MHHRTKRRQLLSHLPAWMGLGLALGMAMSAPSSSPEQFAELIHDESVKWAPIIKRSGARID